MIVDCISDLHGFYPELEGGDLLIVAGDLVSRDCIRGYDLFFDWLALQEYDKKVIIAGNHDGMLEKWTYPGVPKYCDADYLCDSGTEFEYTEPVRNFMDPKEINLVYRKTFKIWGSPWTPTFPGVNPHCTAFMLPEEELAAKWALIPDDTDILVTHGSANGMFDRNTRGKACGSPSLSARLSEISIKHHQEKSGKRIQLHVFGHIHEGYGMSDPRDDCELIYKKIQLDSNGWKPTVWVNASHVNEHYEPVNKPIRVVL